MRELKEGNREGEITESFFFFLFGISSPCAKFQSGEALALFVEKWRKGTISPERVMKANVLRQEQQCMQVQKQGQRAPQPLRAKTNNEVTDFVRHRESVRDTLTLKFFPLLCLLSGCQISVYVFPLM